MSKLRIVIIFSVLISLFAATVNGETLEENWGEFLHYAKIGRLDMANGYGQKIIDSEPDPVEFLKLSKENPAGYDLLLKMYISSEELKDVAGQILTIIEQGRYEKRTNANIIAEEIRRLSSTTRGRIKAIERLKNSGEYAVPLMLNAMADSSGKDEFANITSALPKIGRAAVRPLASALQIKDVAVKAEIIRALGKIGYPQALAYLKYIAENDESSEMKRLAVNSIREIDDAALNLTAAELFYSLATDYYYQTESLSAGADKKFGNVWFWDDDSQSLVREEVDIKYFYDLMAMRSCEWALRADANIGKAIGLWIAAFFKAESAGIDMPRYFGAGHADAATYASTAGPEYLHQALKRAIKDNNAFVALGVVEALAVNAGEKSLLYRIGTEQPLLGALAFDDRAVRYSAAIAIGQAGPTRGFPESKLIIANLAEAIGQKGEDDFSKELADSYALRSIEVMLKLAIQRNAIVDLAAARDDLVNATRDERDEMKVLAGQVLARLDSPQAQRAIAMMAMDNENDMAIRIEAFNSLAVSAKINGNILEDDQIGMIYGLINSDDADAELRAAAAGAYGALNLPSAKVKDLILEKSKI